MKNKDTDRKKILRGLGEIKTPLKTKMHSRPKAKNAEYLNLYLLNKEKDRNQQELNALSKRQNQLKDNLELVQAYSHGLIEVITSKDGNKNKDNQQKAIADNSLSPGKKWKHIKVDY